MEAVTLAPPDPSSNLTTPENKSSGLSRSQPPRTKPRGNSKNEIYKLPAPLRTFPLPTFYPNNPISILHIAFKWATYALFPPREPSVIHQGVWSPETMSVHVTDPVSMRALWEQGFYGKGNLSRSEPQWLKREQVRLGLAEDYISDIITANRRAERRRFKWERAQAEQEAIRLRQAAETVANPGGTKKVNGHSWEGAELAPVGPKELLALPNSGTELGKISANGTTNRQTPASTNGTVADVYHTPGKSGQTGISNGIASRDRSVSSGESTGESPPLKRQKSVRFSPKVESTTFQLSDPPSPHYGLLSTKKSDLGDLEDSDKSADVPPDPIVLTNKEHLQLMPEEAFFLAFGLGVLIVSDPVTKVPLSTADMFETFRRYSYHPPRNTITSPEISPDDPFLVHYAVYHHFRSLGWVPRAGIKFGVDWLLYTRGPVFDHAEFGLIVLPAYTDPMWKYLGKKAPQKSWHWLHGVNRVLSQVKKSLVLVYVEIPPPTVFDEAREEGLAEVFRQYIVREVMVSRWSPHRNRDTR